MFKTDSSIWNCNGGYDCIMQLIILLLSSFITYIYRRADKIISSDSAKVLDKIDKTIFYLAWAYIGIFTLALLIKSSPMIYYTLRLLQAIILIFVISVVAYIAIPENYYNLISQGMRLSIIISAFIWFIGLMTRVDEDYNNECIRNIIMIFSSEQVLISLGIVYIGQLAIKLIKDEQSKAGQRDWSVLDVQRRRLELDSAKEQIQVFRICSLISSLFIFLWDWSKHGESISLEQCDSMTVPDSFASMIIQLGVHIFGNLLPPLSIYYIYYWKNRYNFSSRPYDDGGDFELENGEASYYTLQSD